MLTEAITINVDPGVARFYNDAPQNDKRKLSALIETWLNQYAEADVSSLKGQMDALSRTAESNGLTPEILESIIADD